MTGVAAIAKTNTAGGTCIEASEIQWHKDNCKCHECLDANADGRSSILALAVPHISTAKLHTPHSQITYIEILGVLIFRDTFDRFINVNKMYLGFKIFVSAFRLAIIIFAEAQNKLSAKKIIQL